MVPFGGSQLAERLRELRSGLEDYFGALSEAAELQGGAVTIPEMPVALRLYSQCKELGLPLEAGGVRDQPHIWLQEYEICAEVKGQFDALRRHQQEQALLDKLRMRE